MGLKWECVERNREKKWNAPSRDRTYDKPSRTIKEIDKDLVFSDDIKWCKENFIGDKFLFIEEDRDYIELFLMSQCNHNIIANSSFSWWGAWLNKNENKIVVAPSKWFGENSEYIKQEGINDKDILPKSWIKI